MLKFAEIVVFPSKKVLLLDQVPQILRNKFYRDSSHNLPPISLMMMIMMMTILLMIMMR